MPTTQTQLFPPPQRGSNLPEPLLKWLFSVQNLLPLRVVDTSTGGYAETPPPAGLNSSTGQSNQNQEIIYIKSSNDASVFTLNGVEGSPYTLSTQWQWIGIKSDGTNWYLVRQGTPGGGGGGSVVMPGMISFGLGMSETIARSCFGGANNLFNVCFGAAMTLNRVYFVRFTIPFSITIKRATVWCTSNVGTPNLSCGIYDSNGNKLLDSGVFALNATAAKFSNTFAAVTLAAGTYYFAWALSNSASGSFGGMNTSTADNNAFVSIFNAITSNFGFAANAFAAGALPATLGALTAFAANPGGTFGIPSCFFEPA